MKATDQKRVKKAIANAGRPHMNHRSNKKGIPKKIQAFDRML